MKDIKICSSEQAIEILGFMGADPDHSLFDKFKSMYKDFYKNQTHDSPESLINITLSIYSTLKYPRTDSDSFRVDKEYDRMISESGIIGLLSSGVNLDLLDRFRTLK